jgi:hypothetical protein
MRKRILPRADSLRDYLSKCKNYFLKNCYIANNTHIMHNPQITSEYFHKYTWNNFKITYNKTMFSSCTESKTPIQLMHLQAINAEILILLNEVVEN